MSAHRRSTCHGPRRRSTRRGVTLIELLLVLVLLGLLAAVAALAPRRFTAPRADDPYVLVNEQLQMTVDSARRTTIVVAVHGDSTSVTMLPDGSVVADSTLALDRFTGAPVNAR